MSFQIINIREHPDHLDAAVEYFSAKWNIDRKIYHDSISHSITTDSPLPRWYLALSEERIIGCFGLITNDFISRQDLYPWLCALYVEEDERGKGLGARLLAHSQDEAKKMGYSRLYLSTDHTGYYEKYGWHYIGLGYHPWGAESRIYEIKIFQI